ncbi:condensation domain-containing protein [Saccharopolyspora dendranthemae]|uniref:Condensation domain-containing protein n=1 Tax=Saccharopolyspora dendranthemae TaxID=1181886 RepID=A0A561U1V7_9PSEU|nr:condensation domain-containing protein [Saccharopolyspora dendranthemae]TWF93348.1 condensation domain-containing protein [Saccharopolyspora dendranthemae]
MILADMADWRTPPGRVLRWVPTAAAREAAETAPVDPGPPSDLQADHLAAFRAHGRNRAWTGVATDVDGDLDRAAMTRALQRLVRTHGGFRTWFDLSEPEPVRHLVPAEAVDFEVDEVPVPQEDWDAALQEHLASRFDDECTPDAWPGFALGVVERPGGFGVFWGCDHAFTDGASQILLGSELADLYAAELAEPGGPEVDSGALPGPGERGDFRDYVTEQREAAAAFSSESHEVREWVRMVSANGNQLPRFPLPLGLADGEKAPVHIRTLTCLEGEELAAFDKACKAAGARMSGGVFAAVAATERLLAGRDRYFGMTVLSTRDRGPYSRSQGWFCTFAPVEFDVGDAEFGELAERAQHALRRAKELSAAPIGLVVDTLLRSGTCTPADLGSPQLLSYLDLRWFPGAGRAADARGVHFTGTGRTSNASTWINRDADRLYLLAQVPDTEKARDTVDDYHRNLRKVLQDAAS